ncbi:MAG: hypothetical protein NC541_13515 [bacterium]|nr:hypothetical protein [bacterium]MCM1499976.1 hypothetical protein [Clostridium sp.]
MAEIKIDTKRIINASVTAKKAQHEVSNVAAQIETVRKRLDAQIRNRNDIEGRLLRLQNKLEQLEKDIYAIYAAVNQNVNHYEATEQRINSMGREVIDQSLRSS